jgi:hypothetical protein
MLLGNHYWSSCAGQVLSISLAFSTSSVTFTVYFIVILSFSGQSLLVKLRRAGALNQLSLLNEFCYFYCILYSDTFLLQLSTLIAPFQIYQLFSHLFLEVNGIMIRLPASAITLGPSDLKDFETRHRRRLELEANERSVDTITCSPWLRALAIRTVGRPTSDTGLRSRGDGEPPSPSLPKSSRAVDVEYSTVTDLSEDQDGYLSIGHQHSPENASIEAQQSSPPKDEFHYGGFVESPTQQLVAGASQRPSPSGTLATCHIMDYAH